MIVIVDYSIILKGKNLSDTLKVSDRSAYRNAECYFESEACWLLTPKGCDVYSAKGVRSGLKNR